jgi:integrase
MIGQEWLDRPAAEISRGNGREVLNRVLVEGRSKAFQKRVKNSINMIFNWGIESKVIRGVTQSPVFGLKIVLKEDKKPEVLKLEELRLLRREARERNHPWYPVWAVAPLTGMRSGELFALRWSDVDLEKGLITVQRSYNKRTKEFKCTKAGYWRTVPVSSELRLILNELLPDSPVGDCFVLPEVRGLGSGTAGACAERILY